MKLRDFASNYEGLRPYWKLPPQREIAINLGHNTKQLTKGSREWREAEILVASACWLGGREIGSYRNRCRCQWLLAWGQPPVDTWGAGEKHSLSWPGDPGKWNPLALWARILGVGQGSSCSCDSSWTLASTWSYQQEDRRSKRLMARCREPAHLSPCKGLYNIPLVTSA